MAAIKTSMSILRMKQVLEATGLSRTTIYTRMWNGTFPAAIKLGERSVGWRAGEIDEFLIEPATYRAVKKAGR